MLQVSSVGIPAYEKNEKKVDLSPKILDKPDHPCEIVLSAYLIPKRFRSERAKGM